MEKVVYFDSKKLFCMSVPRLIGFREQGCNFSAMLFILVLFFNLLKC